MVKKIVITYSVSTYMVVILFEKNLSTNYHVFDVKNNLLVLIYIHSILLPSCLLLVLSLIMPCTLVHPFVLFNNAYKMQLLALQICKLDGLP
jgi:hypothetical protein